MCPPLECECSSRSSSNECIVCYQQVTFVQRFPCLNCNKALVTAPLWWCSRRMGDASRVTVNRIGLLWFRLALTTGNSLAWWEFNYKAEPNHIRYALWYVNTFTRQMNPFTVTRINSVTMPGIRRNENTIFQNGNMAIWQHWGAFDGHTVQILTIIVSILKNVKGIILLYKKNNNFIKFHVRFDVSQKT